MAEYTGDVVPLEAPTNPATGKPFGTMVNAAGKANKETADKFGKENDSWQSWLNNPAGYAAAGGLAAEAARRVIPYLKDKLNPPPVEQIEPTFNQPPVQQQPAQSVNPLDEHRIRKAAAEADLAELKVQQAKSAAAPKAAPIAAVPPAPSTSVESSALPQQNLTLEEVQQRLSTIPKAPQNTQNWPSGLPGQVQMPSNMTAVYGGAAPPAGSAAAVAPELVGPPPELIGPPPTKTEPPKTEPTKTEDIKTRVRRTNEKIAADKAALEASVPEGMRSNPQKNKVEGEIIGRGAYNWLAGQEGRNAPAFWEGMVGTKNVPFTNEFPKQYAAMKESTMAGGEPGIFPDPTGQLHQKGGAYLRPKYIPSYIKGAASPAALAATAGLATIPSLATAGYEAYKGNKEAVDTNLSDAWDSLKSVATMPYDVVKAAGKGDFGPLKDLIMSVNPATLLMNATSKHDEEILRKMIYEEKVGAGRGSMGIPPY